MVERLKHTVERPASMTFVRAKGMATFTQTRIISAQLRHESHLVLRVIYFEVVPLFWGPKVDYGDSADDNDATKYGALCIPPKTITFPTRIMVLSLSIRPRHPQHERAYATHDVHGKTDHHADFFSFVCVYRAGLSICREGQLRRPTLGRF